MCEAVPPGRGDLDDGALRRLRDLTRSLLAARPEAQEEYARFLAIGKRSIPLPAADLESWLRDKTVLVTGGTGCIGSALMRQLAYWHPSRLVSVSRGVTRAWARQPGAQYLQADVRQRDELAAVFEEVRPDLVFHVAAQRSPGLAEVEVHRSVTTNVLGTRNVIDVAEELGVAQVVSASTGKALRPYSPDIYAASKRAAEWLLSEAAAHGNAVYSAARFTHVVDNSIIHARLLDWAKGGVIRLHSADIAFYAQSALESAQLLLAAGLGATRGELQVHAITDLDWPVNLLDVTLGVLGRAGTAVPVYISGYDRGYESQAFPGLYDPLTAGDVSPLLSTFEAWGAQRQAGGGTDAFPLTMAAGRHRDELLLALQETCETTQDADDVRVRLDDLSWSLLDAALCVVPREVLSRSLRLAEPHQGTLGGEHGRILAAIRRYASVGETALV
jgi:hypothetical protein